MSPGGVPHVQKEAALIVHDQNTRIVSSALVLGLMLVVSSPARAADESVTAGPPVVQQADATAATSQASASIATQANEPIHVSFVRDGNATVTTTSVRSVADLLAEQSIRPAPEDFVSPAADTPLQDGMSVEYRAAVPVQLYVDSRKEVVRTAATSVAELLAAAHIRLGKNDTVRPAVDVALVPHAIVQVIHVATWTAHTTQRIAPDVRHREDPQLELGTTRVIDAGRAGERETVYHVERRGAHAPVRSLLASRIVRAPRAKVIVHGIATYASFARVAEQGFASALHFAGSALHMIATAYTAACSGCSGITASGVRAGFGIIAVDPSVIPLGTRLFVPGYGRAVAGDTGGAIRGNRIDLGMNDYADAMRFGRRPVTVYVLR